MRLWHYELIPYLPDLQLLAQWRELNSIFKNQPKHILINYVYEYEDSELYWYSQLIISEMKLRGFKRDLSNYKIYFYALRDSCMCEVYSRNIPHHKLFSNNHTDRYLLQCFYNLQEKYDRGQKGFTEEQYNKLEGFVNGKLHKD